MPGSADLLVAESKFIRPHVEAAKQLCSPFGPNGMRRARPDLKAAVKYVANFRGDSDALAVDRRRKRRVFAEVRSSLANVDKRIRAKQTPEAAAVLQEGASIALLAAASRAAGIPDTEFAACQVHGFPVIGDIPDSGLFRAVERKAEKKFTSLHHPKHNQQVVQSLEAAAARARRNSSKWAVLDAITRKTREEVAAQVAEGPFLASDIDARYGAGNWRCLEGFAVEQGVQADGVTPKIRRCDNARKGLHNKCTASHETISVEDASFPMLVCGEFAEVYDGPLPAMQHATDDADKAYRRMAAAHPEATVVAIYDTEADGVRFYTMNGFPFGVSSAVLAFNRHSQLIAMLARRFFGVCCAAFFDDYDCCEPVYAGRTGKDALRQLHVWLGMPLSDGDKDVEPGASRAFLGVLSDLSRFSSGEAMMRSKPERIAKLVVALERYLEDREVHGDPRSLFGKLEFTASSAGYFRLGRAALATLREWYAHRARDDSEGSLPGGVLEALSFFHSVLPRLPPRKFLFRHRYRKLLPIILYTDAMYERDAAVPAQIGIAQYDPHDDELAASRGEAVSRWRHASAVVSPEMIAAFREREQYIGQLEVLAVLCAALSRAEQWRERHVIAFVDNSGALFGLAKGYMRDVDSARMVHAFHCVCAAVGAQVWFEFVPSGANLADQPSRGDLSILRELGSVPFDVRWPDLRSVWAGTFEAIFDEFAPRPTGAEKRARAAVAGAIVAERARAKRARKP